MRKSIFANHNYEASLRSSNSADSDIFIPFNMKATSTTNPTIYATLLLSAALAAQSFWIQPSHAVKPFEAKWFQETTSSTALFGRKAKRGRLGDLADATPSEIRKVERTQTKKNKSVAVGKKANNNAPSNSISPDLAAWVAKKDDESPGQSPPENTTPTTVAATAVTREGATSFQIFEPDPEPTTTSLTSSTRRQKQQVRKEQEEQRSSRIDAAIDKLEDMLEAKTKSIDDILSAVRELLQIPSGNLRPLVAGAKRQDYRLAWVGSDDAVCHVGTGLHMVPLARLQEVFLSCLGRNRIELLEVIRVLGPFPNVKNVLQGNSKVDSAGGDLEEWKITMDSMVDGTGKEILAGTEDNIRRVGLHVYFSDERAIVAVVPPTEGDGSRRRADPLEENGKHVLVFVREQSLDDKLESLRVL